MADLRKVDTEKLSQMWIFAKENGDDFLCDAIVREFQRREAENNESNNQRENTN